MPDETPKGTDWKAFWMGAATFFTVAFSAIMNNCQHTDTVTRVESVQAKQEANGAKIDLAATAATEVKNTLAVKESKTEAKIEDLTKQVAALPTAVAGEVKKGK